MEPTRPKKSIEMQQKLLNLVPPEGIGILEITKLYYQLGDDVTYKEFVRMMNHVRYHMDELVKQGLLVKEQVDQSRGAWRKNLYRKP